IPEPSTWLLWAAGLAAGAAWHRKRRAALAD
ncbi:MAG: PEP-CTERM sorting domain-containing protein, partial [Rubrivivax sp.]